MMAPALAAAEFYSKLTYGQVDPVYRADVAAWVI